MIAVTITDDLGTRNDFPILRQAIHGKPLAYLDSAASAQVPQAVLDEHVTHYTKDHANVHRGAHELAERSTSAYEDAREEVARFLHAMPEEIVFTPGTTAASNLLGALLLSTLKAGDTVAVTEMDHHSTFVVWQELCKRHRLHFAIIPITPDYRLDMAAAARIIPTARLVIVPHVSNVLGTIQDIPQLAKLAHQHAAILAVDGAQAVAHIPVDVHALHCDAYFFSGHKIYAGTGIGVLYLRHDLGKRLPPAQLGGGMVEEVTHETTTYQEPPMRFEAGTPNIAGARCLAAALRYLTTIGWERIMAHERSLTAHAIEGVRGIPGATLIGPSSVEQRIGVISVVLGGVHAHDVAHVLDRQGVAVRAGHHCAQPLAARFRIPATVRASVGVYTTKDDIDRFLDGLGKARHALGGA
jgi:cysteine desulfurase/selenocysteine lyase